MLIRGVTKMLRLFTMTAILAVGPMAAPPVFAQTTPPGHTAASSAKEALDQQDKNFIKEASIGGMAEVELTKMAQKSENADVKRFAARLIEDHSKANEQVAAVAAALAIEPPKALDSEPGRLREKLQPLHGKALDDHYMQAMVETTTRQ
jgi:putative membrane protein